MKFDKIEHDRKYHRKLHISSTSPFTMSISDGDMRRYISFAAVLTDEALDRRRKNPNITHRGYPYKELSPRLRVNIKDTILFAQVLKELLLELGKLPDKPTEKQFREAIRKVAYKYGEPTDRAQTNFLISIKRLNARRHKAEHKGLIHEIIHTGIRARSLAGKDRQLWKLAKMLETG